MRIAIHKHSQDPEKLQNQGVSEYIPEWILDPQFKTAVESLKINEIYREPLAARYGFYLIALLDKQSIYSKDLSRWIKDQPAIEAILKERREIYFRDEIEKYRKTLPVKTEHSPDRPFFYRISTPYYDLSADELLFRTVYQKIGPAVLDTYNWNSEEWIRKLNINPEEWIQKEGTGEALIQSKISELKDFRKSPDLQESIKNIKADILKKFFNSQIINVLQKPTNEEVKDHYEKYQLDKYYDAGQFNQTGIKTPLPFANVEQMIRSQLYADRYDEEYTKRVNDFYNRYQVVFSE